MKGEGLEIENALLEVVDQELGIERNELGYYDKEQTVVVLMELSTIMIL